MENEFLFLTRKKNQDIKSKKSEKHVSSQVVIREFCIYTNCLLPEMSQRNKGTQRAGTMRKAKERYATLFRLAISV